jgi:hypothetical protein
MDHMAFYGFIFPSSIYREEDDRSGEEIRRKRGGGTHVRQMRVRVNRINSYA